MRTLKYTAVFVLLAIAWSAFAVYVAFDGWWMKPVAEADDHDAFHAWAMQTAQTQNRGNTAMVLIEQGAIVDEFYAGDGVDADTLFATASFSKWITALAVMSLVNSKAIELDAPVSRYLSRWSLPPGDFDNDAVTVRRLLSHTAGLTDGLGFGDYEASETVPTLEESLRNPRASDGHARIRVGSPPGGGFIYSGGGYLILELLVEEVTGRTFADYVRARLLDPLGMTRSTYAYPGDQDNVSPSFDLGGERAPTYRYASKAATGFSSSAWDLAKLVAAVSADGVLDVPVIAAMREPHAFIAGAPIWGLGAILYGRTAAGDYLFGHDGGNEPAINATVRLNPDNGDALIVLVSGHPRLASHIGSQWVHWQTGAPDVLALQNTLVSAVLPATVGVMVLLVAVILIARRRRELPAA